MSSSTAELFNWSVRAVGGGKFVLSGTTLNHPRMPDYTAVSKTTPIKAIYMVQNRYVAETVSGSLYRLGVQNTAFAAKYPKARQQLIDKFLRIDLTKV